MIFQVEILSPGSTGSPADSDEVWVFYYQVEMGRHQWDGGNDEIKPKGKKPTINAVQTEFQVTAEDFSLSLATGTITSITTIAMDTLIFVFQNRDNLLESFLKYYILHKGKTRDLPHVLLQNRLIE